MIKGRPLKLKLNNAISPVRISQIPSKSIPKFFVSFMLFTSWCEKRDCPCWRSFPTAVGSSTDFRTARVFSDRPGVVSPPSQNAPYAATDQSISLFQRLASGT
jgi:hypothetical protein